MVGDRKRVESYNNEKKPLCTHVNQKLGMFKHFCHLGKLLLFCVLHCEAVILHLKISFKKIFYVE